MITHLIHDLTFIDFFRSLSRKVAMYNFGVGLLLLIFIAIHVIGVVSFAYLIYNFVCGISIKIPLLSIGFAFIMREVFAFTVLDPCIETMHRLRVMHGKLTLNDKIRTIPQVISIYKWECPENIEFINSAVKSALKIK